MNSQLMLIPQEKLNAVLAVLENDSESNDSTKPKTPKSLSDGPWQNLLDDSE
ncbi:hypothetical protein QP938_11240 [Porticoccaceae bacterium LTM1]|nr:hypothetical protein QP938_11240 [Porticoccaceae bacterium LTM1]